MTEVTVETLRGWPLPEPESSEKHSRGVVLVVGGSAGTPGAVLLAAEAALRAGCGKVRIVTAGSVAAAVGAALPEARVYGVEETASGNVSPQAAQEIATLAESADVTLIGSGFVDPEPSAELVDALLPDLSGPLVLDALGAAYLDSPDPVPVPTVLTLNPSEAAQVLGVSTIAADPASAATDLVGRTGAVLLLGGPTKHVCSVDAQHVVTAGGPGLATAGSGDVQAGLVAGLVARGASLTQAAVWGAWLHGTAGDRVAARAGRLGFLARELLPEVPGLLDLC